MIIILNMEAVKLGPTGSTAHWRSQGLEGLPDTMPLRDRTWVYAEAYQEMASFLSYLWPLPSFFVSCSDRHIILTKPNPLGLALVRPVLG